MSEHTYTHRLNTIVEKLGVKHRSCYPEICLFSHYEIKDEIETIRTNFERQNYPSLKLVILGKKIKDWNDDRITFVQNIYDCQNFLKHKNFKNN